MDLLLDEVSHDIVFNNNSPQATVELKQDLAQRLKIKLLTFAGEWFLDTTIGVPYFQQVFGRQRKLSTVDTIFQQQILADPQVKQITMFNSSIASDRTYNLSFQVQAKDGSTTNVVTISPIQVGTGA